MSLRLSIAVLVLLAGLCSACSGGNGPIQPGNTAETLKSDSYRFIHTGSNTLILGAWEVFIDQENLNVETVPLRTVDMHFNVTPMLKPPQCYDCFLAKNLSYDPDTNVITIDIGFRNPSNITGFDVRGIVTEFGYMTFLNPDGYTDLFSPTVGNINPFVAYKTGVGQREFPGLTSHYETMLISNPSFPIFPPFTYVVEASWPDNCREPYEVLNAGISGDLHSDGSNQQLLQLYARDWQDDVASVHVDLEPVGGGVILLNPNGTLPDVWENNISCAAGTSPGDYELKVWATSSPPFDQISTIYNYITVTVSDPPNPQAEIFNPAERISQTTGESFIWPRHSIAVTSDNTSHVVWVDNSPDPESNIFHVLYTNNESGDWEPPQQIDAVTGMSIYATIATDPDDSLHVVWEDERDHVLGSDIYYSSSDDDFASETILLSGDDGYRNVHPRIESGTDGTLHVTWHSLELVDIDEYEYDIWYMKHPSGSPTWESAMSVVSQEDIVEAFPSIVPGPSGSVHIAFQSDVSGSNGIYFTKNPAGTFIDPVVVTLNNSYQPSLDIAADGTILLAYFDYGDGTFTDIYVRLSGDQGDSWGSPQAVSDSDDAYQYAPDVECTSDGDFHFAWHEEDESGIPGRVLYREYLSGIGWQDETELVDPNGTGAFPGMDSDTDGHIHVIYQLFTMMEPPDKHNYEIWYRDSIP